MVLQSSGAIAFSQIRTEMNNGASGSMAFSTYRANGTLNSRGVTGIPVSGAISMSQFRGKTAIPNGGSLLAKYSGESWNGSSWVDETGGTYNASLTFGTVGTATSSYMNGKTYITGTGVSGQAANTNCTAITFPSAILPTTYTMFHIMRYNGTNRCRIIDGVGPGNFFSGFWNTLSGTAYHNNWITQSSTDLHKNTWVLSTDQNNLYRSNQYNRTSGTPTGTSQQISIGAGYFQITSGTTYERSDWAAACILVWGSTLSAAQILQVESYLMGIYNIPNVSPYTWYNTMTKVNSNFTMVQSGSDPDVQLQMNSINTGSSYTSMYKSGQSLQNYTSVVIDFNVYISTSSQADGLIFTLGSTSAPNYPYNPYGGFGVVLQVYNYGYTRGILLINSSNSYVATSANNICTSSWVPVKIIYTKGTTNTWQVYYNGSSAVTYSDPNNTTWLSSAGNYWGFGCSTGGANGDFYINDVNVSIQQ